MDGLVDGWIDGWMEGDVGDVGDVGREYWTEYRKVLRRGSE